MKDVKQYQPSADLWLGETGSFWATEPDHIGNAFVEGFYFLSHLGMVARENVHAVMRHNLVGGFGDVYAMITVNNDASSVMVFADYWNSLLWKNLMGSKVLSATSDNDHVLAFAHCSGPAAKQPAGSITVLLLNLDNHTAADVKLNIAPAVPRVEYHLSSSALNSYDVYLNGNKLQLNRDGTVSAIEGTVVNDANAVITLQPTTYLFVVLPKASVGLCM